MRSINFEFLRAEWPELAGLGGFAESYAHGDPIGAIAKLRAFCEPTAKFIHHRLSLPRALCGSLLHRNQLDLPYGSGFRKMTEFDLPRPAGDGMDPEMASVLAAKTERERLQIAWGMYRSARRMLQRIVQFEHDDLSPEEQQRIVTNRMSHGT